jgi:hypothetical protein
MTSLNTYVDFTYNDFAYNNNDITTILIIMALLKMTIRIRLKMGDFTYNSR